MMFDEWLERMPGDTEYTEAEKFLARMVWLSLQRVINDTKCCGNCRHNIAMFCQEEDHPVEAWKVCEKWQYDNLSAEERNK